MSGFSWFILKIKFICVHCGCATKAFHNHNGGRDTTWSAVVTVVLSVYFFTFILLDFLVTVLKMYFFCSLTLNSWLKVFACSVLYSFYLLPVLHEHFPTFWLKEKAHLVIREATGYLVQCSSARPIVLSHVTTCQTSLSLIYLCCFSLSTSRWK